MRIIGGSLRGLTLAAVGKGDLTAHLRPTTDRVRESIFNLVINGGYGDPVTDARVLDLFAGTGALGLEAVSRGAASCSFVDDGVAARGLLKANIALTRTGAVTDIIRRDAAKLGENRAAPFTLVFLDPPYGMGMGERALASALTGGWLAPEALVVWEENAAPLVPSGLDQIDQRRYGDTVVTILRIAA